MDRFSLPLYLAFAGETDATVRRFFPVHSCVDDAGPGELNMRRKGMWHITKSGESMVKIQVFS
ncbi:MAG TPA: hypothetical protein VEC35_14810 [Noviherbaspirillum sp.]|nr:hypothetical protein [Noviherbaspirillum sp.]